jgi:hypothetical protein
MSFTSPKLTITNEGDEWTITTSTTLRTITLKFKLGEEYDEDMPKGKLRVRINFITVEKILLFPFFLYRVQLLWKMIL